MVSKKKLASGIRIKDTLVMANQNAHIIRVGNYFFAVTQGAGHWTTDRAKAFRFATQEAATNYAKKRLKENTTAVAVPAK